MILCSHLCLLTDGSCGRFPVAHIGPDGKIVKFELCPDGPEEIGGMIFKGGVMVCGLPDDFCGLSSSSREDFVKKLSGFGLAEGGGVVSVLVGGDLSTLTGTFIKWQPDFRQSTLNSNIH